MNSFPVRVAAFASSLAYLAIEPANHVDQRRSGPAGASITEGSLFQSTPGTSM